MQAAVVTAVPAVGTYCPWRSSSRRPRRLDCGPIGSRSCAPSRSGVAVGSGLAGLALSQRYDVAAGGAISLVAAGAFAISWLAAPRHGAIRHLLRTTHMHTSRRATTTPAPAEGTP